MTKNNLYVTPTNVKISPYDPRHDLEFLRLSNSISGWREHINDRSWWVMRENQCLEIFHRHGYDLQSGVWYCLISCQRHGWGGMANSTLLLAEAFARKQYQCWPPLAATDLRLQIMEWYSIHVATCAYRLPISSAERQTFVQLESAVSLLLEHAVNLQSRGQASLRNLFDYIKYNRQLLQKRSSTVKKIASPLAELEPGLIPQSSPMLTLSPTQMPWKAWLFGFVVGIVFSFSTVCIIYLLTQPSTAISLKILGPANPLSTRWQSALAEKAATLPTINSWVQINNQLDYLEKRLLDSELKHKPYLTISELKTEIYNMRQSLLHGGKPVIAQLDDIQKKIENKQPVSNAEFAVISQRLDALNSKLIYLEIQQK